MKCAAVVVTYNRKLLLEKALAALLRQTRSLDRIYVLDNASTDGTQEYLEEKDFLKHPSIYYHRLLHNTGGAGGFASGVKLAHAEGFDWIWLMDDDGEPHEECLARLLAASDGVDIVGPLVVSSEDRNATSFRYRADGSFTNSIDKIKAARLVMPVQPFNGVLLHRRVVDQVGLPDKTFFVWGDEIDYRKRWLRAGLTESVVTGATFFHPASRFPKSSGWKLGVQCPSGMPDGRRYIYYRNRIRLHKLYRSWAVSSCIVGVSILNILVFEKRRGVALRGLVAGFTGDMRDSAWYVTGVRQIAE